MRNDKTRPHTDERELVKRPQVKTPRGGKQRPDHHPGDREDPLPCHIDPHKRPHERDEP